MNDSLVFLWCGQAEAATHADRRDGSEGVHFPPTQSKILESFMSKWLKDTVFNEHILETGDTPNQNGRFRI